MTGAATPLFFFIVACFIVSVIARYDCVRHHIQQPCGLDAALQPTAFHIEPQSRFGNRLYVDFH